MPRCLSSGLVPDIIFSPLSVPTRMLIGQIMEGALSKLLWITDGTAFMPFDFDIVKNPQLYEKMWDGITGQIIDTEIYVVS